MNSSSRSLPVTIVSGTTDNARSTFGVDHARLVKNEWTELATSASITSGIASSLRLISTDILRLNHHSQFILVANHLV
jgi:hypothetical protein